ncbi:MAG: hypothetical protein ACYC7F_13510, partial [Gemmatimonadaceae bacterium]
ELKKRYEENPRRFFAPLANEYRKAGDLDAAIDLCRMHLEEQPGHLSGHIVYGQALFESSRPAEAKTVFESALTLDPENLIALRCLGDIAKGDGDAATARHWYGRVLEADPRNDEVTALIESLGQLAPQPTVIVAEQHEPPPPPNYAETQQAPAATRVSGEAPTPVIPMAAVPPAPAVPAVPTVSAPPAAPPAPGAPRLSIGLMDLDLNLSDATEPALDLSGAVTPPAAPPPAFEAPPPAFEAPPPVETVAPDVLEPAPAFDESFALTDLGEAAPSIEGPAVAGVDDIALSATIPEGGEIEVQDTSFDALPMDEAPMFAAAQDAPAFGDSLDITASMDYAEPAPEGASHLDALSNMDSGDSVPIGEQVTDPRPIEARGGDVPAAVDELVAEPAAASAAPAPATPADFDALFGNALIADVIVGGGEATAPTEEAGFVADSFVGREPTDQILESAPDIATPPSPFVTETMAELYLQQGFRDEALGVYRQLLAQNPDDKGLAERVMHLEHGTRSSLAIDSVSEKIEAEVKAEEIRRSGSIPSVPEEAAAAPVVEPIAAAPVVEPPTGPAPIIEMITEPKSARPAALTPSARAVVAPPVEPEPEMEMIAEPTPVSVPVVAGPPVRELFARIARRRAGPGGGFAAPEGAPEPAAAVPQVETTSASALAEAAAAASAPVATAQMPAAAPPPDVSIAPGGSVDRLFGMSGIVAADEGAALAMAAAYGGTPAAPIRGEPTRRVTDELSLDSVFRGEPGSERQTAVQRQSSRLRFDQFFPGSEGEASAPPPPPSSSPTGPADDIAQFTDWLKGLKGS